MNYKELENYVPKGSLEGFPKEVISRMLDCQEEQSNPRDVSVFEKNKHSSSSKGGFNWYSTKEGFAFWDEVTEGNFALFFTKYPKQGKICSKCKIEKDLSEFHKHKKGVRSECKECRKKEYEASKNAKCIQEDTKIKTPTTTINQSSVEINTTKEDSQEFKVGDEVIDILTKQKGKILQIDYTCVFPIYLNNEESYTLDGRYNDTDIYPKLLHYRNDYDYDVIDFNNLPKRQDHKRWRAEMGKMYYYIWMFNNTLNLSACIDQFMEFDNEKYNSGNYFKTKEELSDKVNQLNEQLNQIFNNNNK